MSETTSILHRACPAKLNLGLAVVGRRPDGYHELDTVFQELELADDLWITRADGEGVHLEMVLGLPEGDSVSREVVAGDDNLVVRAARAALEAAGHAGVGLRFALHKRIPAGAGLGGGSSDAAGALRLTDALLGLGLPEDRLAALALGLGADVPFFLQGGTRRGRGVGEILEPVADAPDSGYLLVLPPFGCETVAVFRELARLGNAGSGEPVHGVTYRSLGGPDETAPSFRNDLEEPALRVRPELAALRTALRDADEGAVCMSGSGSTFFLRPPAGAPVGAATGDAAVAWAGRVQAVAERAVPGTVVLATRTRSTASVVRPAGWRSLPTGAPRTGGGA